MIRITAELLPGGDANPEKVVRLGEMYIANDGTSHTPAIGHYHGLLIGKRRVLKREPGRVTDFKRLRFDVWDLCYLMLHSMLGDRPRRAVVE